MENSKVSTGEASMNEGELKEKIKQYEFYHIIKLTDDIYTPGIPAFAPLLDFIIGNFSKINFNGKRVLDIGCRDGLLSFEAEKRGAQEIIGIDNNLSKPAVEFLIPYFNSKLRMYEMNLFDLTEKKFGLFNLVIFAGVLYHLRYPFWAFKIIRNVMHDNGILIVETAIWSNSNTHAMVYCPIGSESPYEPTSVTFFNEKGLIDTLSSLGFEVLSFNKMFKNKKEEKTDTKMDIFRIMRYVRNIAGRLLEPRRIDEEKCKMEIDRAVVVCRLKSNTRKRNLETYWDSLHKNREGFTIVT